LTRLSLLLAASCLGTGVALLGGRALLARQPALTPETGSASLERLRRWSPDPGRRREAALLLHSRFSEDGGLRRQLLRGQGWGSDPLAAVVLKNAALDAAAAGDQGAAQPLWRQLLRRFPANPASADALYALGRRQPALRQELLARFPAHPAALAAALEAGPGAEQRLAGTVHLARWGPRWPGAEERLKRACGSDLPPEAGDKRAAVAAGLAEVGAARAALACLKGADAWRAFPTSARLSLARALLKGDGSDQQKGLTLLSQLLHSQGLDPTLGEEAVRLLAQQQGPGAAAALAALPPTWRDSPAAAAQRVLADPGGQGGLALLRRWPQHSASWELQWELSRRALMAGQWRQAITLLEAIPVRELPLALAARQRFWLGYAQGQLGDGRQANATWRELRRQQGGGYYDWRAAVRLGEAPEGIAPLEAPKGSAQPLGWDPLASGDPQLDRLWRLDQREEAWESWREQRRNRPPRQPAELLVEGRLRQGVGDDWTGLAQLEQADLRLRADQCALQPMLQRSLHPARFQTVFRPWAERRQVPQALLQGLSKQESRFTPTVHSAAGAVGLMQLLPSTATELAGRPMGPSELEEPALNVELGSLYLRQLLGQWQDNPLVATAGYNAGPGAVEGWISPRLSTAPELWVEAIPYPETRLYVKKVLGNAWSYATLRPQAGPPPC
jgi:soluble lytic murein transglycosylase